MGFFCCIRPKRNKANPIEASEIVQQAPTVEVGAMLFALKEISERLRKLEDGQRDSSRFLSDLATLKSWEWVEIGAGVRKKDGTSR